ncbi:hypothetical protein TcG_06633 [Trypanosoma cruzi]|nr:hypothetical protein TcG_06633 [Trypanosoma cruzi]
MYYSLAPCTQQLQNSVGFHAIPPYESASKQKKNLLLKWPGALRTDKVAFFSVLQPSGFPSKPMLLPAARQRVPLGSHGVKTVCPSNARPFRALVECRQPCANSHDPMKKALLAPGFPRQ